MRRIRFVAVVLAALAVVVAALAWFVLPGLSSARRTPAAAEVAIATWLLRASVPAQAAARTNPEADTEANRAAGAALFQQNCAVCHGYDGGGATRIGAGQYPRVPPLRAAVAPLSDGTLFYHIRNGIRNTGMPAWNLPDRAIWQLVLFTRHLPAVAPMQEEAAGSVAGAHYVGSAACASCHRAIFDHWHKSRMANVVRDPRTHPDAIIPDLGKPDPLVTFTKDDIAFVYGSRWKQRYFKRVGDDFFPLPAQWDVTHHVWRPYFVPNAADWWAPLYPPDNMQRPTGPLCDGCHSVNYDIATKTVTEWNVGCERCHGPGSAHVARPTRATIINPARLDYVAANDTCIQCHSQGRPPGNPIGGKYYDWPVGFDIGKPLSQFWTLEEHRSRRNDVHPFRRRHRAQEPHAGQRLRAEPDVHARRRLLLLPRPARQRQRRDAARARQRDVPDLPRPEHAERPARADDRGAHAPQAGQPRQRLRRLPHAGDRADAGRRDGARPHLPLHPAGRDRDDEDAERLHAVPRRQDGGNGRVRRCGVGAIGRRGGMRREPRRRRQPSPQPSPASGRGRSKRAKRLNLPSPACRRGWRAKRAG